MTKLQPRRPHNSTNADSYLFQVVKGEYWRPQIYALRTHVDAGMMALNPEQLWWVAGLHLKSFVPHRAQSSNLFHSSRLVASDGHPASVVQRN